jgi:hypothetical protein
MVVVLGFILSWRIQDLFEDGRGAFSGMTPPAPVTPAQAGNHLQSSNKYNRRSFQILAGIRNF